MNLEDDGLPVLTQVLRTSTGQVPAFVHEPTTPSSARSRGSALDGPEEEPAWPRALVIGSDPEPAETPFQPDERWSAHALNALLADDGDAHPQRDDHPAVSNSTVADPRRIEVPANDVFLRTAPIEIDADDRIDEPPLGIRSSGDADGPASSTAMSHDVPLVFRNRSAMVTRERDASFAARVRDSVLQELSGRLDTELDARIAQTLHAQLETALAQLQSGLRVELAEALRDVVGHAVDDAVRRLRDSAPFDDRA